MSNTISKLFTERRLNHINIADELAKLGDSLDPKDCLLRQALEEVLLLRIELGEERSIINALEDFGLQTTGSIYGVNSISMPPGYRRQWMCWQGRKHPALRPAVLEAIQIRKGKRK